jgi:hypothetical protein
MIVDEQPLFVKYNTVTPGIQSFWTEGGVYSFPAPVSCRKLFPALCAIADNMRPPAPAPLSDHHKKMEISLFNNLPFCEKCHLKNV